MNLLSLLLTSLVAAASISPAPAPSPTEAPLREIGRVRVTTPLCKALVSRAVTAVERELDGDRTIVLTVRSLRTLDLDKSEITKFRGSKELTREYVALRRAAADGLNELKHFRESLNDVGDKEQRLALEKFADALAGALYRQKKLAEDLSRYVAWLDAQGPPLSDQERAELEKNILMHLSDTTRVHNPFGDYSLIPETFNHSAQRAADELEIRTIAIGQDEDTASTRIEPAFKKC